MAIIKKLNDHENSREAVLLMEDITSENVFHGVMNKKKEQKLTSRIVELNNDFYVSLDYQVYKCQDGKNVPQLHYMHINPAFFVQNKTMLPLEIYEIENPETTKPITKLQSSIPPGLSDQLYQIDVRSSNTADIKFKFYEFGSKIPEVDTTRVLQKIHRNLTSFRTTE